MKHYSVKLPSNGNLEMRNLRQSTLLWLSFTLVFGTDNSRTETITIARVGDDPTKYKKVLKPLLDYVVSQTRDVGITEGSVAMTKNIDDTLHLLKAGKIDWVTASIAPALIYHDKT